MVKTILESKFREWQGLDRLQATVHDMRCIFREITKDDFGIDGEIEIVAPKVDGPGYEPTGGIIKTQVKSGSSYIVLDTPDTFETPVRLNDLNLWNSVNYPIILIVFHPADGRLYWKDLKAYIKTHPAVFQPPLRITFSKQEDEFSTRSYDAVCQLARTSPPRVSTDLRERLFTNLLPVEQLPRVITRAPTDFLQAADIRRYLGAPVSPICIVDGCLYTLSDLRDPANPLRDVCASQEVSDIAATEWTLSDTRRRDFVSLLNQLLGIHERMLGLRYNNHFKRVYFPREDTTSLDFSRAWRSQRTGRNLPPRQTAKRYTYGSATFWRHLAAHLSFQCIGGSWYLRIIPKYFFTLDGEVPWDSDKVGPYTTSVKSQEWNLHVLNHVLFWTYVLSQDGSTIDLRLGTRRIVVIRTVPLTGIAPFGIIDDPAALDEDEISSQLPLDLQLFGAPRDDDANDDRLGADPMEDGDEY